MTIVDTKNFQTFLQPYHNQQLFCVKCTQKFRHFFCIFPTKVARICNWEDLIFGRWLNAVDARKIKIRFNIKSKSCVVSEILLPRAKWLGFFSSWHFGNIYLLWVEHPSQHGAICDCFIVSFKDYFFLVNMTLTCKRRFN